MFAEREKDNLRKKIQLIVPDSDGFVVGVICNKIVSDAIKNIETDPQKIIRYANKIEEKISRFGK